MLQPDCDVVAAVEDGEAALDAVATHAPDILLVDVSLPRLNGFEVAEKLNDAKSPVKVIFVSAYTDPLYVERALQIGAKAYILKGSMRTELPAAIREVMNGGRYRSPLIP